MRHSVRSNIEQVLKSLKIKINLRKIERLSSYITKNSVFTSLRPIWPIPGAARSRRGSAVALLLARWGRGGLPVVSVVCCQVKVSESG